MKHLIAIMALLFVTPVSASEPLCAYADESMAVFLYPDYKSGENGSYFIWVRTDLNKPRKGMENVAYMMYYREYSGDLSKYRDLRSMDYDKSNKVIWSDTPDNPKWHYIAPETVGYLIKEQVRLLITQ